MVSRIIDTPVACRECDLAQCRRADRRPIWVVQHAGIFVMATQFLGSTLRSPAIGVNHTGVVLGCLLGAMHLGWVVLAAAGAAQPVADFVYWLHFIRPVWVIEP